LDFFFSLAQMYILIGTNVNMDNWRLEHLKALHAEDPEDDFVLYALAQEYSKLGLLQDSLDHYLLLKGKSPDYVGLYYHLAGLYAEMDESEKALKIYDEGITVANKLKDLHALGELKNAKTNLELEL